MERDQPQPSNVADLHDFLDHQLDQISAQLRGLARTKDRLQALLDAVMAVSRELELPVVLERIVTAAMDLVQARYGALGVLDEQGTGLAHFIPVGLSEQELANLGGVELPRGRGLLGTLIRRPEPLPAQSSRSLTALSTPSPTTPSPPPAWPASNPKAPPGPCAGAPQATGHLPPLLITPGGRPKYLYADPGIPLGVDADQPRADHTHPLSAGSTVVFFTDGLIEHPQHPIDTSLDALARTAATLGDLSLNELCKALVDHHPSDGHDDMAILALRTPLAT